MVFIESFPPAVAGIDGEKHNSKVSDWSPVAQFFFVIFLIVVFFGGIYLFGGGNSTNRSY